MSTTAAQAQRDSLIAQNRAKFQRNRVVYITPSGIHASYDLEDEELVGLVNQLKEAKFEIRATTARENYTTNDWFKHGDDDFFESYVITTKSR